MLPGSASAFGPTGSVDRALVATCFVASGAMALVFEVVWLRYMGLAFGATTHSVTLVMATFMGGLAVGAMALGRWSDRLARPLRVYAAFEAAVGLWGMATPSLFGWAVRASAGGRWDGGALRAQFAVALLILLPPTFLMGASLPLLTRWRASVPGAPPDGGAGRLYALNTMGGVVGAVGAGFFLLPALGLAGATRLAGSVGVMVALVATWIEWRSREHRPGLSGPASVTESRAAIRCGEPRVRRLLVATVAVSGAATMAYEIAWTRALASVLSSSTYAFSAMLAAVLVGLALGASLVGVATRSRSPGLLSFGLVTSVAGLAALAFLPAFSWLPELVTGAMATLGVSHSSTLAVQFGTSFVVMIVPATAAGAVLPMGLATWVGARERLGHDVGVVYGASTIGSLLGCFVAGFGLLPVFGSQRTVEVSAILVVCFGAAALASGAGPGARRVVLPVLCLQLAGLMALAPRWDRRLMAIGPTVYARDFSSQPDPIRALRTEAAARRVLFHREGLHSSVMVYRKGEDVMFSVNGKTDGGTTRGDMRTQLLLGHLPALLHPAARSALVIGLGTGVTTAALAAHPLDSIEVAEIEPAVAEAASFFSTQNRGVLRDPRITLRLGDGRRILANSERFDVITSEPSNPWIAGVGNLFTREFYALARSRLAPDGIIVQWFHAYSMTLDDVRMIVRTFQSEFPYATVWRLDDADYLLVARDGPLAIDPAAFRASADRSPVVREDLVAALGEPGLLPWLFLLDEEGARRFADGAPMNTDDRPRLEFSAPRSLHARDQGAIAAAMRRFRSLDPPFGPSVDRRRFEAPAWRLAVAWAFLREGDRVEAEHQLDRMGAPELLASPDREERLRLLVALGRLGEAAAEAASLGARPGAAANEATGPRP